VLLPISKEKKKRSKVFKAGTESVGGRKKIGSLHFVVSPFDRP